MIPVQQHAFLLDGEPLAIGDVFTIAGHWERRTFWQWLTRQPLTLRMYVIVADVTAEVEA